MQSPRFCLRMEPHVTCRHGAVICPGGDRTLEGRWEPGRLGADTWAQVTQVHGCRVQGVQMGATACSQLAIM